MEPKFKLGERIAALGYRGAVKEINVDAPMNEFLYTIACEVCKEEHQVWESDMQKVEDNAARG